MSEKNVAYILTNEHNSDQFLSEIALYKCSKQFLVVNVTDLQASDIEEWLTGVPTLVEQDSGRVFRGTQALEFVRSRHPDKQEEVELVEEKQKEKDGGGLTGTPNVIVPPEKQIGRRSRSEFSKDHFKRKH